MAANDTDNNNNPWTQPWSDQQNQMPQQGQQQQMGANGQNPFTAGMNANDVRNQVQNYYNQMGVTPQGNSVDYWTQKWGEFGNNDPNYYWQRLQAADEFTGGPGMPGSYGGGGGMQYSAYTPSPHSEQLFNMLMNRANQSLNVSGKDPIIAAQTNAFGADQERGYRNYMRQLAESEGPQANLAMEKRMGAEKAAQNTGNLRAQLMGNELAARRGEIQQALSLMGNQLGDQERLALQKELAYLSNDQFMRELGLRAQQQAWNQDAYSSGLMG